MSISIVEKAAERLKQGDQQAPALLPEEDAAAAESNLEEQGSGPRAALALEDSQLRRVGLLPPEAASEWLSREVQRIKQPIFNTMKADDAPVDAPPANRLMVTSANPGDGKSFTAFNLARSLADELDYSVLLIDGDVAKPGLSRNLGLKDEPGLMYLLSHADIPAEDCVVPTDRPRLSILPAGQRNRRAAESLASQRMKAIVDELASDTSRILLFDSAPLLATADAQMLSANVGQILFVVRAGHTEKRAVEAALTLIEPAKAETSLILSQGHQVFEDRYAGYYGMYPYSAHSPGRAHLE